MLSDIKVTLHFEFIHHFLFFKKCVKVKEIKIPFGCLRNVV